MVADILVHHLANSMAQSRPASECLTLQKKAWLFATRSTPSLTGMPSMWTAYSRAVVMPSLRSTSGHCEMARAICCGSRVSRRL
jgi:hypothetical protein